ncbi:MAG: isoleucine--tRNA ligase [Spirochaetaceae bacterium]|nr:MAG: isoleucine--tRNA ligase [Spirochaetaceae bacterium]
MYKPVDAKLSFPKMEEGVLEFWQKHNIFEKSIQQREGCEEYVFYDGPPFATGLPHFGHFVPGTIKDIIPRYKAMRGLKVERRFGWDCHGLPVEYEMEKELGISGKRQIEEYGIARFNESCRSIVLRYTSEWRSVITRLGRWIDFDNDYKTMDPDYMESIWWIMQELWNRELLYEGFYILPYCPRCSTALSNFELNLGGYQDVQDPSITVKFKRLDEADTYFLAWTTTPWTLPSNLALALGPEIEYVKVADGSENYILAKERLETYYKSPDDYQIVEEFRGKELAGIEYEPLFPYFAELRDRGAFRTRIADYVSTEEGTGIVHTAPGFGEDDYSLLKDTEVPTVCPVDAEARFTEEVTDYQGLFVKEADKRIIKDLKQRNAVVHHTSYLHAYPHCWRCTSPLIYRAISSWFVNIQKIKSSMLEANNRIFWVPGHIREGRFGKWLEGARDWAISRNRYWGNPLPIWRCDECGQQLCIGSRAELENRSKQKVTDLHKHFVDEITFPCEGGCSGTMRRIPEVLDCWFESGAMPYAQNHYPFENREHFEANFPADFISEGLDQTRGWFYTLVVLAAALFDKPAFTHCIVNGLVLAEDGKKMSKSARNYTDPMEVMNEFGADALRLFLMHSACVKAEDLRYSDAGVKEVLKNVIIPLWNSYSFFVTYANIDKVHPERRAENPENPMDRWIVSETQKLVQQVAEQLEQYDLQKGIDPIVEFIDLLNNWYIRRSRRRFWRPENRNDVDKRQAYQTLYSVLLTLVQVAAPFIPFITEEIYRNLKAKGLPESVHLTDFPTCDSQLRDLELEQKMSLTRQAVSMGRALRTMHNLKIRQPLKALHLVTKDQQEKRILIEMEELIKDELNVRGVVFRENEEELVEYTAKPNYKVLGKQLGKDMKAAAVRIEGLSMREIQSLLEGATLSIEAGQRVFDLTEEGVIIARTEKENLKVLNEGSLTVALDAELTDELIQEGMARDLVRGIQNLRKEMGLEVTDRIELSLFGPQAVKQAVEANQEFLKSETLAVSWRWLENEGAVEIDCGQEKCLVSLVKSSERH